MPRGKEFPYELLNAVSLSKDKTSIEYYRSRTAAYFYLPKDIVEAIHKIWLKELEKNPAAKKSAIVEDLLRRGLEDVKRGKETREV